MHPVAVPSCPLIRFQSAPGREAGRCQPDRSDTGRAYGFNPRPAVRPGDARMQAREQAAMNVSIRARP